MTTTTPDDLVERFARAMFAAWPTKAVSPHLAELAGVEIGEVITYDRLLEIGGDHRGLLELAKAAADLHADRIEALEAAAHDLVTKLDAVTEETSGMFVMAAMRGDEYTGPNYGEELKAMKAALKGQSNG